ncbi:hypothetical protein C922_05126 [Plasmodium inui San Antonio 1]|uniref:Uncharacterized protein n=1 Tax=Plasmodium inui San Antonio 1 TaxID=1237626 RepID=W7AGS1_9APIC|nr:hypothetical protein C922_05126 [Plasmodium inui San Antonio 1]EUD64486.1 hypothetical protein C922_05126 [Plasmodium inui San Antonio 1]
MILNSSNQNEQTITNQLNPKKGTYEPKRVKLQGLNNKMEKIKVDQKILMTKGKDLIKNLPVEIRNVTGVDKRDSQKLRQNKDF